MVGKGRARTILVAGTASHVGKSTIVAGLCRHFADCGVDITPFKAQNMSNNARAVPGGEIGVSQYVQARAAGVPPTTDHNPVLLKPRGEGESQLVVDGQSVGHFAAGTYYEQHWHKVREAARAAHDRLAAEHDVVVAEGAGAIAEPNLLHRDLANLETARFSDATILLVADIERGGAFASVVGSMELLPEDVRDRVDGVLINKFRGDRSILDPALADLESRYDLSVLGVLPHEDPGLPAEDSVSLPPAGRRETVGGDDGVPDDRSVTIGVPRLPRISNFTDLEPLAREPGVRVCYLPLDAPLATDTGRPVDAVVIPGTKNTVDDLQALRAAGMDERLRAFEGPIVGLCGGYQLLGERLRGADIEGTGDATVVEGLGLLPVETMFTTEKRVEHVERDLTGAGLLEGASGAVTGYEIHMGETEPTGPVRRPFTGEGAASGAVLGTYLHDLFENETARETFLSNVYASAARERPDVAVQVTSPFEDAADLVALHADLGPLLPADVE